MSDQNISRGEQVLRAVISHMNIHGELVRGAGDELLKVADRGQAHERIARVMETLASPAGRRYLDPEFKAPTGSTLRQLIHRLPVRTEAIDGLVADLNMRANSVLDVSAEVAEGADEREAAARAFGRLAGFVIGELETRDRRDTWLPSIQPALPDNEVRIQAALDEFSDLFAPSVDRADLARRWARELGYLPEHEFRRITAVRLQTHRDLRRHPDQVPKFDWDSPFFQPAPLTAAEREAMAGHSNF